MITDVNDYRLDLARSMPQIDRVVNVSKEDPAEVAFDEMGLTEGFDVGLEMSGNGPAFNSMIELMNNGGKIALLGLVPDDATVSWSSVIFKGLEIKGTAPSFVFDCSFCFFGSVGSGGRSD